MKEYKLTRMCPACGGHELTMIREKVTNEPEYFIDCYVRISCDKCGLSGMGEDPDTAYRNMIDNSASHNITRCVREIAELLEALHD